MVLGGIPDLILEIGLDQVLGSFQRIILRSFQKLFLRDAFRRAGVVDVAGTAVPCRVGEVAAEVGVVHPGVPAGAAARTFPRCIFSSSCQDVGSLRVQSDLSLQWVFIFCSSIGAARADVLIKKFPAG